MATPVHVSDEEFEQTVLKAEKPVLVDFWAPWCGPCKMIAPAVEDGDLMHTGDGALRRAGFFRHVLAAKVDFRVILQRNAGVASLLRTVVDEAVFTNIEVTRAGAASPVIRLA